jgi:hypothetical protein
MDGCSNQIEMFDGLLLLLVLLLLQRKRQKN